MKTEVKTMLSYIALVFVFGLMIHFGTMTAKLIWPVDRDINVYHHYNFNSVTQEWEETDRTAD